MMKQLYQLVNKLFEKTLPKIENPLLPSGDHLILVSILQNTSLTLFKSDSELKSIVKAYDIESFEKIEDRWDTSIVIINGTTWSCNQVLANQLEDYINGQEESKKRIERDA